MQTQKGSIYICYSAANSHNNLTDIIVQFLTFTNSIIRILLKKFYSVLKDPKNNTFCEEKGNLPTFFVGNLILNNFYLKNFLISVFLAVLSPEIR